MAQQPLQGCSSKSGMPVQPGGLGSPASSSGSGGGKGGGKEAGAGSLMGENGGALARAWRNQVRAVWMEKAPDVPYRIFAEVIREHAQQLTGVRPGSDESDRSYLRRCFQQSGLSTYDQFMMRVVESVAGEDQELTEEMDKHAIEETMDTSGGGEGDGGKVDGGKGGGGKGGDGNDVQDWWSGGWSQWDWTGWDQASTGSSAQWDVGSQQGQQVEEEHAPETPAPVPWRFVAKLLIVFGFVECRLVVKYGDSVNLFEPPK